MCYLVAVNRIGVRELRQHASRWLARVKTGETFEVTERGRLVAILAPPPGEATARDRLIRSGRLIPAARPFRLPERRERVPGEPSTDDALREVREESLP